MRADVVESAKPLHTRPWGTKKKLQECKERKIFKNNAQAHPKDGPSLASRLKMFTVFNPWMYLNEIFASWKPERNPHPLMSISQAFIASISACTSLLRRSRSSRSSASSPLADLARAAASAGPGKSIACNATELSSRSTEQTKLSLGRRRF